MEQDDDLSALLPETPPPRPDRREAAIDTAMRRFDGTAAPRSLPRHGPERKTPWLGASWRRPQFGAVLAAGIVALVVLPIWLSRGSGPQPTRPESRSANIAPAPPAGREAPIVAPRPRLGEVPAEADRENPPAAASPAQPDQADAPKGSNEAALKAVVLGGAAAEHDARSNAASRAAPPPPIVLAEPAPALARPAAPPPATAIARREREEEMGDVIVTARRVDSASREETPVPRRPQARRTNKRGDWNACTVNDPARSLGACTAQAGSGAAIGHMEAGLSRAWNGDLDGAITEFDAMIAASPQSDMAYLNRGLAYEHEGDHERALADLDRAVRQAPSSARAYYNRSLVLRRKGEKERADADAARAVALDPRYDAVIR